MESGDEEEGMARGRESEGWVEGTRTRWASMILEVMMFRQEG